MQREIADAQGPRYYYSIAQCTSKGWHGPNVKLDLQLANYLGPAYPAVLGYQLSLASSLMLYRRQAIWPLSIKRISAPRVKLNQMWSNPQDCVHAIALPSLRRCATRKDDRMPIHISRHVRAGPWLGSPVRTPASATTMDRVPRSDHGRMY